MSLRTLNLLSLNLGTMILLGSCNGAFFASLPIKKSGSGDLIRSSSSPSAIIINGGDQYTNTSLVKLSILPPDTAFQMYITNTENCGGNATWASVSKNVDAWTLAQINSAATVSVKFKDQSGNESPCSSDTILHDNMTPSVVLTSLDHNKSTGTLAVTATFSEPVLRFEASDITLTNASLTRFSGDGKIFNFVLTPSAQGLFSVSVASAVAQDAAGNFNIASNTISLAPPGAPRNIQVDFINSSSARLDWIAPSFDGGAAVIEYIIYSSTNAGSSWTEHVRVPNAGALTTTVGSLTQGLNYVFGVSARNVVGEGDKGTSQNLNLKKFEPVLAVRAMGCINCHANGSSIVTDFGKGAAAQMDGYYSGNHHSTEGWAISSYSKITTPIIPSRSDTDPSHARTINMNAVAQAAQSACEPGQHQEFFFESFADGSRVVAPSSDQDYRIRSAYSGLNLMTPDSKDWQETYFYPFGADNRFKWRLEGDNVDGYQIKSNLDLNKCLNSGVNTKDRWDALKLLTCNAVSSSQKFKLVPGSTAQAFQLRPMHNTNNNYCIEIPGGDYADPKEAIRQFILKRSQIKNPSVAVNVLDKDPFIGAPDRVQLLQHLNSVNRSDDWFYQKNRALSPDLSTNPVNKTNFFEISGNLTCDGDLAFKKPLVIKNLNLSTLTGCRIYVVGPVFQQGTITYTSLDNVNDKTNLQIVSSDFISMGVGTNHCETAGDFSWYFGNGALIAQPHNPLWQRLVTHRPALRANYFSNPQSYYDSISANLSQMGLEDASCRLGGSSAKTNFERRNLSFERLMLVAPMIQSRYIGDFKGVVVSEFANFTLGQFKFDFHDIFRDANVSILPLVPSSEYLKID